MTDATARAGLIGPNVYDSGSTATCPVYVVKLFHVSQLRARPTERFAFNFGVQRDALHDQRHAWRVTPWPMLFFLTFLSLMT